MATVQLKQENVPIIDFNPGVAFTLPIPKRFLDDDIQLTYPSDWLYSFKVDDYYQTSRQKTGFVSVISAGGSGCHCIGRPSKDLLSPPWVFLPPEKMKVFSCDGDVKEWILNLEEARKNGRKYAVDALEKYSESNPSIDPKKIPLSQTSGYRYELHNVDNEYYAKRLRDLGMRFVNDGLRQLTEKGLITQ